MSGDGGNESGVDYSKVSPGILAATEKLRPGFRDEQAPPAQEQKEPPLEFPKLSTFGQPTADRNFGVKDMTTADPLKQGQSGRATSNELSQGYQPDADSKGRDGGNTKVQ